MTRNRDWWRIALRELPTGLVLGSILGVIGFTRIVLWQKMHIYSYGPHYMLLATAVGLALVGIVAFGSLAGSMLPFLLKRIGFDPASASAPFVATRGAGSGEREAGSGKREAGSGTREAGPGKREGAATRYTPSADRASSYPSPRRSRALASR